MTKRDFFRLLIKLFGLYSLIFSLFTFIPNNISYVFLDYDPMLLLWIGSILAFIVVVYIFLLVKTDLIVRALKLDKGFDDERIEFGNFDSLKLVKLATLLIGGFLVVDYVPSFLQFVYFAFKSKVAANESLLAGGYEYWTPERTFQWSVSGINIFLGIVMLANYDRIAKWLTRKEPK